MHSVAYVVHVARLACHVRESSVGDMVMMLSTGRRIHLVVLPGIVVYVLHVAQCHVAKNVLRAGPPCGRIEGTFGPGGLGTSRRLPCRQHLWCVALDIRTDTCLVS